MANLVGYSGQYVTTHMYDVSGTIGTGTTPQLILPVALMRSSFIIQNISDTAMYLTIGAPPATASLSSGGVGSVTAGNAGFGYSRAPMVVFLGGANANRNVAPAYTLAGLPEYPSSSHPAAAHCVMTGAAGSMTISSIVVDDPGSGYAYPPLVLLVNDPLDPYGCSIPSATNGVLLAASGGSYTNNGSVCTTDQMALYCSSSSKAFTAKFTL